MRRPPAVQPTQPLNGTVAVAPDALESLILDLLEWIGPFARPYDEVLEAWRTSCPRFPVWEDARETWIGGHQNATGRRGTQWRSRFSGWRTSGRCDRLSGMTLV